MKAYEKEYQVVRARAANGSGRQSYRGQEATTDDNTQNTFLRYLEKGFDRQLDPSKGNAVALLKTIHWFIRKESARDHARELSGLELAPDASRDGNPGPLDQLIETEKREFVSRSFSKLTDRERLALARYYGPRLERLSASDHVAKHRAIRKLRKLAEAAGLLD